MNDQAAGSHGNAVGTAPTTEPRRGRLTVFVAAAPGAGKTYAMLEEAHRLKAQGKDVVVGLVETYGRPKTEALLEGLEVIPRKVIAYKGLELKEMDLDAILAQDISHFFGNVGVLAREELWCTLSDGDPASQPAKHLAKLQTNVASSHHDQVLRHFVELHDGGGVVVLNPVQSLHGRIGWARPGINDDRVGRELEYPACMHRNLQRMGGREPGLAHQQIDTTLPDAAFTGCAELLDDLSFALTYSGHIDR